MSSNVMAILEDARTRLGATQHRAQEVEAHAQRILDLLAQEAQAWREAIQDERARAKDAAGRLAKRWSDLEERIGTLEERAKGDWTALGQGFDEHWQATRKAWTDCDGQLAAVEGFVAEHQQDCRASGTEHRQLADAHDKTLHEAGESVRATATQGNQTQGAALTGKASERQESIDASIERYASSSRRTAEAMRTRREAATQHVDAKKADFDTRTSQAHQEFETGISEQVDGLKQAAAQARTGMVGVAQVISDVTATLVEGADGVVDALNVTNVGLSTAVGIVQTSVEICDEVIDAWNS